MSRGCAPRPRPARRSARPSRRPRCGRSCGRPAARSGVAKTGDQRHKTGANRACQSRQRQYLTAPNTDPSCQRRSNNRPRGGAKPYNLGTVRSLSPKSTAEVHGRVPRAARTACHGAKAVARVGGTCGPSGSSGWRSGGLGFFGFALLEPEALAIHFEDMDVMGQAIEERAGEAFRSEDLGPFVEGQVGGDES